MGPKNTFRDEVEAEKVSEQEMLERDQRVTYLSFKNQAEMREADRVHTERAIEKLKAFGNQIFRLPDSEGRVGVLEQNKRHMEQLEKQLELSATNRVQHVLLSALEEKFGLQAGADENAVKSPRPDYKGLNNSPTLNSEADGNATEPKELKDD